MSDLIDKILQRIDQFLHPSNCPAFPELSPDLQQFISSVDIPIPKPIEKNKKYTEELEIKRNETIEESQQPPEISPQHQKSTSEKIIDTCQQLVKYLQSLHPIPEDIQFITELQKIITNFSTNYTSCVHTCTNDKCGTNCYKEYIDNLKSKCIIYFKELLPEIKEDICHHSTYSKNLNNRRLTQYHNIDQLKPIKGKEVIHPSKNITQLKPSRHSISNYYYC